MLCDMQNVLNRSARRLGELRRTNVQWIVPQSIGIALIVLVAVPLLAVGCETERAGYEKTIAAWEECMSSESEITDARGIEVKRKYEPLFERQPHYVSSSFGVAVNEDTGERDWDRTAIRVKVTKKVDQSTLPEEDRIPACLDGVPVQISEESIETEVL